MSLTISIKLFLPLKKFGAICKVIIESAILTDEEKLKACMLAKEAKADFVKTSTGFSKGGATAGDVALMRYVVGSTVGVKASGGIRTTEDAKLMIASGADRIGASASVENCKWRAVAAARILNSMSEECNLTKNL